MKLNVYQGLAGFAIIMLFVALAGCGKASRSGSPISTIPPAQGSITGDYDQDDDYRHAGTNDIDNDDGAGRKDRDNDTDNSSNSYYDNDDNKVRDYGHAANAKDDSAISKLVRLYFTTAVRQDGAGACSMLVASYAKSVPGDLGSDAGPAYSRGATCAIVISKIFYHYHRQLLAHVRELRVTAVRVDGFQAVAVLGFKTLPGRFIWASREGHYWKISSLLDLELP